MGRVGTIRDGGEWVRSLVLLYAGALKEQHGAGFIVEMGRNEQRE